MAEWISVKDRLPEDCKSVLATDGHGVEEAFYYLGEWFNTNAIKCNNVTTGWTSPLLLLTLLHNRIILGERLNMKIIQVPTGEIMIIDGENGKLECLSLGDYGKAINLNQHKKVIHGQLLPLSEKWVCTISTQYGCSMGCRFCDVPKVGPGKNATLDDLLNQVGAVRDRNPRIRECQRFNIHYARMGEPTWNWNVLDSAVLLKDKLRYFNVHPVVSTMMPIKNESLEAFIKMWCHIKNDYYKGEAGLQLSINSTSEQEREMMFSHNALPLYDISYIMNKQPDPVGRKYTLNFAIAEYTIDAERLAKLFPPSRFICKLTPMHKTNAALRNGIKTIGDYTESYPYEQYEQELKSAGYEVLVFIASKEEDESRITCGNAILSDRKEI
ncbi:MAG: Fe-S-oxidoreductase [Candidatus Nanoarchaeia archaeon]|nr:Fe-S-oxidoreductase [Candidatus Nanoarchaeia archaeon]